MGVIIRNATKLKQLTETILDITRIENRSLILYKEEFCLNEIMLHAIADARNPIPKEQIENIKFVLDQKMARLI
jgi:signal transduction histidine kinase